MSGVLGFWAIAAALGLLSFFEPCTIATHTLFSVRTHSARRRAQVLLAFWATRAALSAALLALVAAVTPPPDLHGAVAGVALAVMASVYVVSRFAYLPVPHLEAWRWFPGGKALPPAMQLGLTLPACTLPLVAILGVLAAVHDAPAAAAVAGLLFATLFAAPTVISAVVGVSDIGRRWLSRAALATPYVTAALLYGGALFLLR